jgi:hAT family C-terminal dimerisation region
MFPTLTSMACDIFVVPVSTVASESCFSAANRVLTDKRTRLGEKVFETLVLLKDWYDAESRLQDKSLMYSIDREEVTAASSSDTNERMPEAEPEVNQHNEEEDSFARYSNPYMYNYEEYGYMYNSPRPDYF